MAEKGPPAPTPKCQVKQILPVQTKAKATTKTKVVSGFGDQQEGHIALYPPDQLAHLPDNPAAPQDNPQMPPLNPPNQPNLPNPA